jgi:hypothetical protein
MYIVILLCNLGVGERKNKARESMRGWGKHIKYSHRNTRLIGEPREKEVADKGVETDGDRILYVISHDQ